MLTQCFATPTTFQPLYHHPARSAPRAPESFKVLLTDQQRDAKVVERLAAKQQREQKRAEMQAKKDAEVAAQDRTFLYTCM